MKQIYLVFHGRKINAGIAFRNHRDPRTLETFDWLIWSGYKHPLAQLPALAGTQVYQV